VKSLLWAIFGLFLVTRALDAQALAPAPGGEEKQAGYTRIVGNFFDDLKTGKFNEASHVLIDTNKRDRLNAEKHEGLSVPLQKLGASFGVLKEFKPVISKSLGDGGAIGYEYGVAVYEKGFVRFEFCFIRDSEGWHMLQLDFKDNFASEIRELAGVHFQESAAQQTQASSPTSK
jgi:hypothetical protein